MFRLGLFKARWCIPKSCVGLPMTKISLGSLERQPVSMARISWLKFKTAISLLVSAHDKRLFDSLSFLYGLCRMTLSVLVTAVRHTWMPSYLPNLTLPTRMRFKLNENAGFIENDISLRDRLLFLQFCSFRMGYFGVLILVRQRRIIRIVLKSSTMVTECFDWYK